MGMFVPTTSTATARCSPRARPTRRAAAFWTSRRAEGGAGHARAGGFPLAFKPRRAAGADHAVVRRGGTNPSSPDGQGHPLDLTNDFAACARGEGLEAALARRRRTPRGGWALSGEGFCRPRERRDLMVLGEDSRSSG